MRLSLQNFVVLIWIFLIYLIGVYWFAKGFLLTRIVVNDTSYCDVNFTMKADDPQVEGCWMHKSYSKAVVIIIDALRFDFARFNRSLPRQEELPYQNKLRVIAEMLNDKPQNSRLYKFVADPPTTTLQRLKGLTAGSLPTFIDISQNFASSEIVEDNIIDQLRRLNKQIVFMGDDTWMSVYPKRFKREFPFPSFNVKDLHTVDNGVIKNLYPELKKLDWDVLIAHFLGVDHCGHRYGPYHPEMAAKLQQMDQVIRNVIRELQDDTILFVMGDHGMTRTGDHGGDSPNELDAALFIYSPSQITATKSTKKFPEVAQVDFVPTISLLLGIPVPFASLGMLIPDLFNHCPHWDTDKNRIKQIYHTVKALRLNAYQVQSYLKAYSKQSSEFPYVQFAELELQFHDCEMYLQEMVTLLQLEGDDRNLKEKLTELRNNYKKYLRGAREMCQGIWAKFDNSCLLLGVLTLVAAVAMQAYGLINTNTDLPYIPLQMVAGIIGSLWLVIFLAYLHHVGLNPVGLIASLSLGFPAIVISTVIVCRFLNTSRKPEANEENASTETKRDVPFSALKHWDEADLFGSVCLIVYGMGMFSNSYVVYEDQVSVFLLISLVFVMFCKASIYLSRMHKSQEPTGPGGHKQLFKKFDLGRVLTSPRSLMVLLIVTLGVLLRIQALFRACREEQWTCNPPAVLQPLSAIDDHLVAYKNIRYFCSVGCVVVLMIVSHWWLRHHGNLNGYMPMVLLVRYCLPVGAGAICFYWAVQGLPHKMDVPLWPSVALPFVVYAVVGLTLLIVLFSPLMVYMVVKVRSDKLSVPVGTSNENILPHVYKQVKENWQTHLNPGEVPPSSEDKRPPMVYGLATVYSSPLIVVVLSVSLLLMLLLGDGLSGSVLLQLMAAALFLEFHSAFLFIKGKYQIIEDVPWCSCVAWGLLTSQFFFSSGHQASFPNIRWQAAYTGFHGDFENYTIPVTLITLNTFAAQVLSTFSVPLLLFWPLVRGKNIFSFEKLVYPDTMQKGEFVMNEQPNRYRSSITRLLMAHIFFHGFKLFNTMFAAAIHRRHLMVWKIFAPHLIFESVSCGIIAVLSLFVYLILMRIDSAINKWVDKLPS